MKNFLRVMKAMSDPNRVKIVKMLQHREMCVCELTAALEIAQPTVSGHLKMLEDAGLVSRRKEGLWVNYCLTYHHNQPYAPTLLANLYAWLDRDPEIQALLAKLPSLNREVICKK